MSNQRGAERQQGGAAAVQPPPPVERAVVVHGHKLVRECQEILKARRRRSKEELRDSSDERFF